MSHLSLQTHSFFFFTDNRALPGLCDAERSMSRPRCGRTAAAAVQVAHPAYLLACLLQHVRHSSTCRTCCSAHPHQWNHYLIVKQIVTELKYFFIVKKAQRQEIESDRQIIHLLDHWLQPRGGEGYREQPLPNPTPPPLVQRHGAGQTCTATCAMYVWPL